MSFVLFAVCWATLYSLNRKWKRVPWGACTSPLRSAMTLISCWLISGVALALIGIVIG